MWGYGVLILGTEGHESLDRPRYGHKWNLEEQTVHHCLTRCRPLSLNGERYNGDEPHCGHTRDTLLPDCTVTAATEIHTLGRRERGHLKRFGGGTRPRARERGTKTMQLRPYIITALHNGNQDL